MIHIVEDVVGVDIYIISEDEDRSVVPRFYCIVNGNVGMVMHKEYLSENAIYLIEHSDRLFVPISGFNFCVHKSYLYDISKSDIIYYRVRFPLPRKGRKWSFTEKLRRVNNDKYQQ